MDSPPQLLAAHFRVPAARYSCMWSACMRVLREVGVWGLISREEDYRCAACRRYGVRGGHTVRARPRPQRLVAIGDQHAATGSMLSCSHSTSRTSLTGKTCTKTAGAHQGAADCESSAALTSCRSCHTCRRGPLAAWARSGNSRLSSRVPGTGGGTPQRQTWTVMCGLIDH